MTDSNSHDEVENSNKGSSKNQIYNSRTETTTDVWLSPPEKENVRAILESGLDGCLVKTMHLTLIHQGLN